MRFGALDKLEVLDMDGNKIGDGGMKALASAVASGALDKLEWLNLAYNNIGDDGINELAAAVSSGALASCTKVALAGFAGIVLDGNAASDTRVREALAARNQ